jgi:prepilin-type processing-associated H-X9-DG protein
LHQIGVALRQYVDDFKRYPAYLSGNAGTIMPYGRSNFWDARLLSFLGGNQGVFLCPGQIGLSVSNNWYAANSTYRGLLGGANRSYGFNTYGVGLLPSPGANFAGVSLGLNSSQAALGLDALRGQPESTVFAPGDTVAAADYDPNIDDDGDGDHPDCLYSYALTGKHHQGGAVVVFCDAHVEYAKTNRWSAPGYMYRTRNDPAARQRWNNDHQPHLEVTYFP